MEATKINIRFWLFKVQCYRNNNTEWNTKLTLTYLEYLIVLRASGLKATSSEA